MMTALVVLTSVLIALLLLTIVAVLRIARDLKRSVNDLENKLVKLNQRLAEQQAEVDSLRKQFASRPDALSEIFGAFSDFRGQNPIRLVRSLTGKLFTAYFKQRRMKALPERVSSEIRK